MRRAGAVFDALALARTPALAGVMRQRRLPEDVLAVIKIAAGHEDTTVPILRGLRTRRSELEAACKFYLQEAVLYPEADHRRALGLAEDASDEVAREHRRWLLMWLHPDRNPDPWEAALLLRVQAAWTELHRDPAERVPTKVPRATVSPPRWVRIPIDSRCRRSPVQRALLVGATMVPLLLLASDDRSRELPGTSAILSTPLTAGSDASEAGYRGKSAGDADNAGPEAEAEGAMRRAP